MRKLYILGLISILLLINSVTACSYPSIVDCNTREEVGIVTEEWVGGICTYEEMMECAEIWTDYNGPVFPKFDGWYCGDTHYHTNYTNVNLEKGWSIPDTSQEATKVGLDFFFATDHSNSIKYLGGETIWNQFKDECKGYSNCLIGNEINCNYTELTPLPLNNDYFTSAGNHLLAYDYSSYINDGSDNAILWYGPTINTPSCEDVILNVSLQGGFSYAAHPEGEYDILDLSEIFGEGVKTISKWKDYSLPFTGLEIWNGDLENSRTKEELDNGLEKWVNETLLKGRHVYISGGTDTHAAYCGPSKTNCNSSFAKVATCVNADSFSKANIIDSFKNGKSYVTNNGALIMEVWSYTDTDEWNPSTISVGISGEITVCEKLSFHIDFEYDINTPCTLYIYEGDIESGEEKTIDNARLLSGKNNDGFIWNDFASDNLYYRAECKSSDGKKRIYTNPIWVNVDTNDRDNDDTCDTYDTIDNIIPENNMVITRNTIFDYGEYILPDGINIIRHDIFVDCQNGSLIGTGNLTSTGIMIGGNNVTLKNCKITNFGHGIDLAGAGNRLIKNNAIFNNNFGIVIDIESPNTDKIENNDIFNNTQKNIYNFFDANINAENNWWGTASKIEIEESIYSCDDDSTKGCVDFIPYLCEQYPTNKISPCLEGDVDWDCIVNIFDLAKVGLCYNQPATGQCENADLNSDGKINIFDLATVGLNYGREC